MPMYTGLDRVLRNAGVKYREVPGWKTRTAHGGGMHEARGVIWHHTATPAAAVKSRNNPTTQYMTNGLKDENGNPYPLANLGLAWDGSVDLIAAGTGAHAGKGVYSGIPRDQGNRYLFGIEVEGTIGLTWSSAQLESAARIGAALDREFGNLIHIGHYEWAPGRKTDPTGIPGNMPALRAAIKRGTWGTVIPAAGTTNGTNAAPAPIKTASIEEDSLANYNDTTLTALIKKAVAETSIPTGRGNRHLSTLLTNYDADFGRVKVAQNEIKAEQAGQREILQQIAESQGVAIDWDRFETVVRNAAHEGAKAANAEGVEVNIVAKVK